MRAIVLAATVVLVLANGAQASDQVEVATAEGKKACADSNKGYGSWPHGEHSCHVSSRPSERSSVGRTS